MVDNPQQAFGFTESDHPEIDPYERAAESCCEALEKDATGGGLEYSNLWSLFKKGNLFDKGLPYIDSLMNKSGGHSKEFERRIQLFLENSALYYRNQKDTKSFMEFVRRFTSVKSKHDFLSTLDYINIARLQAGLLKEADFLEKAGCVKFATNVLLWYLFYYKMSSLWGNNNNNGDKLGWPLNHPLIPHKDGLCQKILSLAKLESDDYFHLVYTELEVLSDNEDQHTELKKTNQLLLASQRNNSPRGEILSIRKILDFHLCVRFSLYDWEDDVPVDLNKHCEEKMFQERVSVTTLVFYWNMWKENVVRILKTVGRLECILPNKYADFSLNYFGVRKLRATNWKMVFLLVDKDAEWIRKYGREGIDQYDEKLLTVEPKQLVFAIRSYWQSQLFHVGIKVLKTLEKLHRKSKLNGSAFHQSTCLLKIFEVSKFLLDCKYLNLTLQEKNRLQKFLGLSTAYFDHVFPLDWCESVSHDLVSLIETDLSVNLLNEILHRNADINGNQAMGRVMMLLLFSPRKPDVPLQQMMQQMITSKLQRNLLWVGFLAKYNCYGCYGLNDFYVAEALQSALAVSWKDFQMLPLDMSPHSFLHLLDRVLFMDSCCLGKFFTAKSSFVGSITRLQSIARPCGSPSEQRRVEFRTDFIDLVTQILSNKKQTKSWIRTSKINVASYYPLLILRMVMMLCLICLEDPCYSESLHELLFVRHHIACILPKEFVKRLKMQADQSGGFHLSLQRVSEAFMSIGDPLLIVSSSEDVANPIIDAPACAIYVDLRKSKEEIMSLLFPSETALHVQSSLHDDGLEMVTGIPSSNTAEVRMNWNILEEIYKATNVKPGERLSLLNDAATIKKELKRNVCMLCIIVDERGKSVSESNARLVSDAVHQLEKLSSAVIELSMLFSGDPFEDAARKNVQGLVEMLQGSRPRIDEILSHYVFSLESGTGYIALSERSSNTTEDKGIDDANIFDCKLQWWQL